MEPYIDGLLGCYESGRITRRGLVRALAGMAAAVRALGSEQAHLEAVSLNHVTLHVSDARKSADFYRQLLALPIRQQKASATILGVGSSFIALDSAPVEEKKGIDHFCFGVKDFNLDRAAALLKQSGLQPEVLRRIELYFRDPDGIRVQLSSPDYAGQMP